MINSFTYNFSKGGIDGFYKELQALEKRPTWLDAWLNFADNVWHKPNAIQVKTSGSTGSPKSISYTSLQAQSSALRSLAFFELTENTLVACPLGANTIGGQMMFFRALFGKLELALIEPTLKALENLPSKTVFTPCLVAQLQQSLQEKNAISSEKILLGGSAIPSNLEEQLQGLENTFYSSYAMTETLSHVAVKTLNGVSKTKFYLGLKNIEFSLNAKQCLQIKLPEHKQLINTNDIAQVHSNKEIEILGRADNVIITSGKKVNPEPLEKEISVFIDGDFAISALPNQQFESLLTLVLEKKSILNEQAFNEWQNNQESHTKIRKVLSIDTLPKVANGKLNRKVLQALIKDM